MKNPNIYILTDKKVDGAINLPLLKIDFLEADVDFTQYDALIFTSKNAIYSLESFSDESWKNIPSYAIAPMTAKILKSSNSNLAFTGKSGHGDKFALELIPLLQNQKVLYLRGSKVVSNLVSILNSNNIICDEEIVYQSGCKDSIENDIKANIPPIGSTIIFSSPSTIQCFLDKFEWNNSYKAISIGKTTAKYFPEYIKPIISDETSLEACVRIARE
jgi:uroporphyrinogen-III synthase